MMVCHLMHRLPVCITKFSLSVLIAGCMIVMYRERDESAQQLHMQRVKTKCGQSCTLEL